MTMISIFTDGGSRGNPGPAAYGFVIKKGETTVYEEGKYIGIQTNNTAEYTAILKSLEWVSTHRESIGEYAGINFYMDSQLAREQLVGNYRVKQPHLQQLLFQIKELLHALKSTVTFTHIPRERNTQADRQVNLALDNQK